MTAIVRQYCAMAKKNSGNKEVARVFIVFTNSVGGAQPHQRALLWILESFRQRKQRKADMCWVSCLVCKGGTWTIFIPLIPKRGRMISRRNPDV
jgi:hypothetical protein